MTDAAEVTVLTSIVPMRTYLWSVDMTSYRISVLKQGEVWTILDRGSRRWMQIRDISTERLLSADYVAEKLGGLAPMGTEARNLTMLIGLAIGAKPLVAARCPSCDLEHRPRLMESTNDVRAPD